MIKQSAFEFEVLQFVSNDYEASHTIAVDLSRELGRLVTEDEIDKALQNLTRRGLVHAYVYESEKCDYIRVELDGSTSSKQVTDLHF